MSDMHCGVGVPVGGADRGEVAAVLLVGFEAGGVVVELEATDGAAERLELCGKLAEPDPGDALPHPASSTPAANIMIMSCARP
ncbi:MAG: hypothetical protein M3O28_07365 [Actinomycetota bacterium]|nr:hypothetical protein [Actinomycetota bacterium]